MSYIWPVIWSILGGFALGVLASLVASYLSPRFNRGVNQFFSRVYNLINPDRFDLTGEWEHRFREPSHENPDEWEDEVEIVEFRHLGNKLTGIGRTTEQPRTFYYDLSVKHDMVFGTYTKEGTRGSVIGNGTTQMILDASRGRMVGQATWFDSDTVQIESSRTIWRKLVLR